MNKCSSHIENIGHNAIILYGHLKPIIMHICAKTQPTGTSTSQITVIYKAQTNMPTILHMPYLAGAYMGCMYIYVPHEVTSTKHVTRSAIQIFFKLHFTLLTYITEQIWLQHCTNKSQCPQSVSA